MRTHCPAIGRLYVTCDTAAPCGLSKHSSPKKAAAPVALLRRTHCPGWASAAVSAYKQTAAVPDSAALLTKHSAAACSLAMPLQAPSASPALSPRGISGHRRHILCGHTRVSAVYAAAPVRSTQPTRRPRQAAAGMSASCWTSCCTCQQQTLPGVLAQLPQLAVTGSLDFLWLAELS